MTTPYSRARRVERDEAIEHVIEHGGGIAREGIVVAAAAGELERESLVGREGNLRLVSQLAAPPLSVIAPRAPCCPPAYPSAGMRVRSKIGPRLYGLPVSAPTSMYWPQPPRKRPGPPESAAISRRCTKSGATLSITSTGTPMMPDGKAVVWMPSLVGRAPVPPQENQT